MIEVGGDDARGICLKHVGPRKCGERPKTTPVKRKMKKQDGGAEQELSF